MSKNIKRHIVFISYDIDLISLQLLKSNILNSKYKIIIFSSAPNIDWLINNHEMIKSYYWDALIGIPIRSRKLNIKYVGGIVRYTEFCIRSLFYILKRRRLFRDSIFHAIDLPASTIAYAASIICNAKFIIDYRELYTETNYVRGKLFWNVVERGLAKRACFIITRNEIRALYLKEKLQLDYLPGVIQNIPSIDSKNSEICSDVCEKIIKSIEIFKKNENRLIIYVGNLSYERGINNLIKSFTLLDDNYKLLLFGKIEQKYIVCMKRLIANYNLNNRVIYYGYITINELPKIMTLCDVGVAIYRNSCLNNYYCASRKIFEYINLCLPIVGPKFPEVEKIIDAWKIGATFDPESESSIASAIKSILTSSEKYYIVKSNVEKAKLHYTWDKEVLKYYELINKLK